MVESSEIEENRPKVIIGLLVGIPASGKTTLARRIATDYGGNIRVSTEIVSLDDI